MPQQRLTLIEGGPADLSSVATDARGSAKPAHLGEEDYAAIWSLMARGRMPSGSARDRWSPRRGGIPWPLLQASVGLTVWVLAGVGLWSMIG